MENSPILYCLLSVAVPFDGPHTAFKIGSSLVIFMKIIVNWDSRILEQIWEVLGIVAVLSMPVAAKTLQVMHSAKIMSVVLCDEYV